MTSRPRRPADGSVVDPGAFPALRAFCRGYLHEDALVESGTAAGAAAQCLADSAPEERAALRSEWARLAAVLAGAPLARVRRAFGELGAAWQPRTRAELRTVDDIFRNA